MNGHSDFISFTPAQHPDRCEHAVDIINTVAASEEDRNKLFAAASNLATDPTARITLALHDTESVGVVVTTIDESGARWLGSLAIAKAYRGIGISRDLVRNAVADRVAIDGPCEILAYVRVLEDGRPNPRSARTLERNGFALRSAKRIAAASLGDRARFWPATDQWADLALFFRPANALPRSRRGRVTWSRGASKP